MRFRKKNLLWVCSNQVCWWFKKKLFAEWITFTDWSKSAKKSEYWSFKVHFLWLNLSKNIFNEKLKFRTAFFVKDIFWFDYFNYKTTLFYKNWPKFCRLRESSVGQISKKYFAVILCQKSLMCCAAWNVFLPLNLLV